MIYNTYPLAGLSKKAVDKLPQILDKAGYNGRYEIGIYGEYLCKKCRKAQNHSS